MFRLLNSVPRDVAVACSGGMDSMVALDFLIRGKKNITVLHFDHGTDHAKEAAAFVRHYCRENKLPLHFGQLTGKCPGTQSAEEFWRDERYAFFKGCALQVPLVSAHHLTDVIEWWLFTSLHGAPKIIPYERLDCNMIRPFLLVTKKEIQRWALKNKVPHVEDPSNENPQHMRNFIRHSLLPQAFHVNPGLEKTMRKLVLAR